MSTKAKDHYEKKLEDFNDVFADIVNVLLFQGENRVREDELETRITHAGYNISGHFAGNERDSKKLWKNSSVCLAILGLENQTEEDPDFPIRVIAYDGADYQDQLRERARVRRLNQRTKTSEAAPHPIPAFHPVITVVLYFGDTRWKGSKNLKGHLEIPPGLEPYVSDYKINLFEIAYLEPNIICQFRSDFRYVAEYFVYNRLRKEGISPPFKLTPLHLSHVEEFIELMNAVTNSRHFNYLNNPLLTEGRDDVMLTYLFDEAEAKGREQGESLFKKLTQKLLSMKQYDELEKATKDEAYKEELYKKYAICP